jgi:hypothetical protein
VLLDNGAIAQVVEEYDPGVVNENVKFTDLLRGGRDLITVGDVERETTRESSWTSGPLVPA